MQPFHMFRYSFHLPFFSRIVRLSLAYAWYTTNRPSPLYFVLFRRSVIAASHDPVKSKAQIWLAACSTFDLLSPIWQRCVWCVATLLNYLYHQIWNEELRLALLEEQPIYANF
jgi:hypothetical protein